MNLRKIRICIDAGHGGHDPGAVNGKHNEKDTNLLIALQVGKILNDHGVAVEYTRKNDSYKTLSSRYSYANSRNVDLFVSIHSNSATNKNARGIETYHYPNSKEGLRVASIVNGELGRSKIFTQNRGVKNKAFAVLKHTKMPSILIEAGFISNSKDSDIINSKWKDIALEITKGILSSQKIPYNKPVDNKESDKIKDSPQKQPNEFLVRVDIPHLNIRKGPGTNYPVTGRHTGKGTFTIIETKNGWYKLKSGAGWISQAYATKV